MTTEWRATKVTPGGALTLKGFQISGGITASPPPTWSSSSSHGPHQAPSCSWIREDGLESSASNINRNRVFLSKDTAIVLTRVPQDTINLHVSRCELNSDGARGGRRNSESFGYRLIRNNSSAPVTTSTQSRKVFPPGKRLPTAPKPAAASTATDTSDRPGGKIAGALICTKSTLSSPSTRQSLTIRKRSDPMPGLSAGKEDEEPEQNLTDQPRSSRWKSSISVAVPPSLTCLDLRDSGKPPPAETCSFSDPFSGASTAFQKRIAELASLVGQTVTWEKQRKHSKISKLQTKSG